MTEIVRKITLDLSRKSDARVVYATQEDMHSRKFVFTLTDCGRPYHVQKGLLAMVNALRPDGEAAAFIAEILDDGTVSYTLDAWILGVIGETACSVSLYDSDKCRLTSSSFIIDVHNGIYLGDEASSSENYSTWLTMVGELNEIKNEEAIRVIAEEQREESENERSNNESSRIASENLRAINETSREIAEGDRASAENKRKNEFASSIYLVNEAIDRANEISDVSLSFDHRVRKVEKRLSNLEYGRAPYPFESDSLSAYEKSIPEDICPYAELLSIGGQSYVEGEFLTATKVRRVVSLDRDGNEISAVELDDSIMSLPDYGEGIDSSLFNSIDWNVDGVGKKYVRRVRRYIFTGNEAWTYVGSTMEEAMNGNVAGHMCVAVDAPDSAVKFSHDAYGKGIVDGKLHISGYWCYSMAGSGNNPDMLASMLRAHYNNGTPVTVIMPLREPEESDLGDLLNDDNLIKVESGGKLRFVNDQSRAVPSNVIYQLKEVVG